MSQLRLSAQSLRQHNQLSSYTSQKNNSHAKTAKYCSFWRKSLSYFLNTIKNYINVFLLTVLISNIYLSFWSSSNWKNRESLKRKIIKLGNKLRVIRITFLLIIVRPQSTRKNFDLNRCPNSKQPLLKNDLLLFSQYTIHF